ncbi:hypothetical protein PR048_029283 [Dryococelus australis]|uniref:Uncharacterized protein n=1 Tax=Dryococelus australis TaxID=614101 RepID=A0ABQ9GCX9_9NEOP|nr:hypothetical protein PR048_029283 [Dryococelus australis]
MYTEVEFAIESQFIRQALDDSEPIADLQVNKQRVPYCQVRTKLIGICTRSLIGCMSIWDRALRLIGYCLLRNIICWKTGQLVSGLPDANRRTALQPLAGKWRHFATVRGWCSRLLAFHTSDSRRGRSRIYACGNSCPTMPLIGGFSRGSPVSPILAFRRSSTLTSLHPHFSTLPKYYLEGYRWLLTPHPSPERTALSLRLLNPLLSIVNFLGNLPKWRRLVRVLHIGPAHL